MAKLIITLPDGSAQTHVLETERTRLGRHPDNDLVLVDQGVSAHHALIIALLGNAFVEDLGSTNGTLVNGTAIRKQALNDGDELTLGRCRLHYEAEASADSDFEQTLILKPEMLGAAFAAQLQRAQGQASAAAVAPAAPTRPSSAKLTVCAGPNLNKTLTLTKALTTLGKPGVQVAAITRRVDGYYIVHVGGSDLRRAQLNGRPLDQRAQRLQVGDQVELLDTLMRFSLGD